MTKEQEKLCELLGLDKPESSKQSNLPTENDHFKLPNIFDFFYANFDGWEGYIDEHYFNIFNLEEALEQSAELAFKSKMFVIGNDGASEMILIDENGQVYLGDKIDPEHSFLPVAEGLIDLLSNPTLIDAAFE